MVHIRKILIVAAVAALTAGCASGDDIAALRTEVGQAKEMAANAQRTADQALQVARAAQADAKAAADRAAAAAAEAKAASDKVDQMFRKSLRK